MPSFESIKDSILKFRDERDWAQFHTPKNLAAAISIEAAELQETMLWKTPAEISSMKHDAASVKAIADEIADVCIYSILLSHEIGIDLIGATEQKLSDNRAKYPAELARGNALKYTELGSEAKKG